MHGVSEQKRNTWNQKVDQLFTNMWQQDLADQNQVDLAYPATVDQRQVLRKTTSYWTF